MNIVLNFYSNVIAYKGNNIQGHAMCLVMLTESLEYQLSGSTICPVTNMSLTQSIT